MGAELAHDSRSVNLWVASESLEFNTTSVWIKFLNPWLKQGEKKQYQLGIQFYQLHERMQEIMNGRCTNIK